MAYMTHCCCGCMTVRTGTKVLAILSLDFVREEVACKLWHRTSNTPFGPKSQRPFHRCISNHLSLRLSHTPPSLLGLPNSIGFILGVVFYSAVCANFDQVLDVYRQSPEVYDTVKSSYGLFVAYAVISAIGLAAAALCIRGAYTDQRHLLLPYLVFEGLLAVVQGVVVIIVLVAIIASIYFLMVVVSFYKQLAFISQNPGQIERILPDFECHTSGCKLPWPNYKPAVNVKGAYRWARWRAMDGWMDMAVPFRSGGG
ncbi:hypothetical protein HPB51_001218 [Rhipicephalus microplus]|uniref:Uncharacterized protein n=1 Tax=Rhipicephalus microplus TaxID=6941 RepID=A0A9J6DRW5_RHIMP|nr:hypothetical protein HPB51_001218 [Rhipicephalus microplus]